LAGWESASEAAFVPRELAILEDANAINGEQKRLDCSDSFSRPGSHPNIQRQFGRFWKFVRAFTPNWRRNG